MKSFIQISLALLVCLTNSAFIYKRRNFHKIKTNTKEAQFFRSARLKKSVLEKKIRKHDIDVVISFLGPSKDQWYKDELEVCQKNGVKHYDFGFSTKRLLNKKRFLDFMDLLDELKSQNTRTLIHCKAGSDRTGLMASLIQMHLFNFSYKEAFKSSFHRYYGHIRNKNTPVEKVLRDYQPFEKQMNFKEWLETSYSLKNYRKN